MLIDELINFPFLQLITLLSQFNRLALHLTFQSGYFYANEEKSAKQV